MVLVGGNFSKEIGPDHDFCFCWSSHTACFFKLTLSWIQMKVKMMQRPERTTLIKIKCLFPRKNTKKCRSKFFPKWNLIILKAAFILHGSSAMNCVMEKDITGTETSYDDFSWLWRLGDGLSSNFKVSGVVVMIVFDLKCLFKSSEM